MHFLSDVSANADKHTVIGMRIIVVVVVAVMVFLLSRIMSRNIAMLIVHPW